MISKYIFFSLLIVAVFATGYMVGRFSVGGVSAVLSPQTVVPGAHTPSGTVNTTTASGTQTTEGTKVNTANVSDAQKAMLKMLGVNVDTLVVTPAMIACAEASVGTARALEIKNGATPSFTEGVKLVACYK